MHEKYKFKCFKLVKLYKIKILVYRKCKHLSSLIKILEEKLIFQDNYVNN